MLNLEFSLTPQEMSEMSKIAANVWFTRVKFANATSPGCQEAVLLDANHEMKKQLMTSWIRESVQGKRVLDLFSANGAFAVDCMLAGAREVVGVEFDQERVRCAQFLGNVLERNGKPGLSFYAGDVYDIAQRFPEPFDVVLCMGGLYHIADPPFVLSQIRKVVKEKLILQTSGILSGGSNRATFVVREDQTSKGLTSLRGGKGVWKVSVPCFRAMLTHAGFRIQHEKQPPFWQRSRFPWYCVVAEPA